MALIIKIFLFEGFVNTFFLSIYDGNITCVRLPQAADKLHTVNHVRDHLSFGTTLQILLRPKTCGSRSKF